MTRPARSSTLRCLEIAGWLRANGFMSSDTSASPAARRARIARLVGSASAAKATLSRSVCPCITIWLYYQLAIKSQARRARQDGPPKAQPDGLGAPQDLEAVGRAFISRSRELVACKLGPQPRGPVE